MSLKIKTAIIGAGISGISAGVNFLNKNYEDFLIFEANNRIGGRCNTIQYGDSFLELGAQFIHGQVDNPIYKIAIENKLIPEKYKDILTENNDDKITVFNDSNGNKVDEKLLDWAQFCLYKSYDLAREQIADDNKSVGEFVYESYINLMQEKLGADFLKNEKNFNLINSIYQFNFKWECMYNGCSSLFDLSLKNFRNYIKLEGDQVIEFTNGYKSLFECLISRHKEKFDKILKLNFELKSILLCSKLGENKESICEHCKFCDDENKIVLRFDNKTIVICEQVLCTMSLGFLKENIEDIIKPSSLIPIGKLEAINRMGFGTVNKLILVYEKPFWDESLEQINPIWLIESKDKMLESLKYENFDYEKRWTEDICTFSPTLNHKNIIVGWIGGNYFHENLSDDAIKKDCTQLLRKFLRREDIPEPIDVVRSNWHSNPFTKGSYSFYAHGTNSDEIEKIAMPISFNNKNFVLFAGEATHDNYYSTVHGAFLTGLRESERILKSTENITK